MCVCRNVPNGAMVSALRYYPKPEGNNVTRCVSSWTTWPQLYTFLLVVSVIALGYVSAHLFYVATGTGMFSCDRSRRRRAGGCSKTSVAGLFCGLHTLFWMVHPLWRIVNQGEITIGNSGNQEVLAHFLNVVGLAATFCLEIGKALFYMAISDMAFAGAGPKP